MGTVPRYSEHCSFLHFLCEIELSLQSRAHFADLIFRKCSPHLSFWHFQVQIELSLVLRTFVDNFPRSSPGPAETETLLRWPQEPHYPKKRSVSRPRVSSPVSSHASELLHFTTAWRWEADISWWGGWHDGVNADHDNGPELGRFLTRLPLINEIKWETSDSRTNVKCQHMSNGQIQLTNLTAQQWTISICCDLFQDKFGKNWYWWWWL